MLTPIEIAEVIPVIVSLVVIEGLLSVDNALAIAALASHLPKPQQQLALKLGIIGAYLFRGIALFFAANIIANPWLKLVGATYLIYLMASNLVEEDNMHDERSGPRRHPPGLLATVVQIELMDLTLSLDNVVAAVALDKRLWVICTGVFIGILVLRFLAGFSIRLLQRFPILHQTAFLLIGFVGVILVAEVGCEMTQVEFHVSALEKFAGIAAIISVALLYDRSALARTILKPVIAIGRPTLCVLDKVIGTLFWPATKMIEVGRRVYLRKTTEPPPDPKP